MYIGDTFICRIKINLHSFNSCTCFVLFAVEEIANLRERIIEMEEVRNAEKVSHENQLEQLRTEYEETKDQLVADNMMKGE